MYDPITAYDIQDIINFGLDGAKIMIRFDFESKMAKYTQITLKICADVIRKCNNLNLPIFIEPLPVFIDVNGQYKVKKDLKEIIKVVGITTALGGSSLNIWLKLPYVDHYEAVALSTTSPILMLGGESINNPVKMLISFKKGMLAGKNIKGCLVGRNILYPGNDDPVAVALAISKIIHEQRTV